VDGSAREQRKVVTVLFCDVAGSTALGESLDAEALRALLARYFERMKSIVERHGGVVEKFIGDAVMAVFGLPAVHEDDAVRALQAATEMQLALPELGVEGRIGVCSGEVVTGTEERLATGDVVNVAARLQQAAQPGETLLGETTLRLARDAVEAEPIEPLPVKGKREPVPAWRLVSVSTAALERRFDSPLVGREKELGALAEAWERACDGPGCELLTVVGAAGVGKSRLAAEFLSTADATVVRGRCLSYGEGITYWPVVEVLRQLEAYRSRLELDPTAADALAALLGPGGTFSTDEIAWAFRKLLEAVAAEGPIVAVFDDIQWGEDVFLDLLEHVAFLSTGAPILLLCMGRPELLDRRSGWDGVLRLQPLSPDEAELLMRERIGGRELGAEVRERILRAAGGNPLFVEEMAAMVQASDDGEVAVPPTLQALLTARLDQLDPPERSVLERGAVEGEVFHHSVVQALTPEEPRLTTRLTALVRKELIRPDRPVFAGEDAFRFRHLLMRDAAYEGLPKAERAELHERFADWLAEHGVELVELDELLGYHLEQAHRYRQELGPPDEYGRALAVRAGERLGLAGRRALARGDLGAAVNLLGRAVALLPQRHRERQDLLSELGYALFDAGDLARADSVLTEAIEGARATSDRSAELQARTVLLHWRMYSEPQSADLDALMTEAMAAVEVFEKEGDELGLARAWKLMSELRWHSGGVSWATEAIERHVDHARRARNPYEETWGIANLAYALVDGPVHVAQGLERARELLERATGGAAEPPVLAVVATLEATLGEFDEARLLLAGAKQVARGLSATWYAGLVSLFSARVERLADDLAVAETDFREALAVFRGMGERWFQGIAAIDLARLLLVQGRRSELAELGDFIREVEGLFDPEFQMKLCAFRARELALDGEIPEALALADRAVAVAQTTDQLIFHAEVLRDRADILAFAARPSDAAVDLEQAIRLLGAKGNKVVAAQVRAALAEVAGVKNSTTPRPGS
jgi:class 3 adenylate cyclase/tetratricopeptide (TPR) repeat protein